MTCCRMVGYIGTDRDRLACAVRAQRDDLVAARGVGYGVAHYTDDALLLNRRPGVQIGGHPFDEFLGGVKSRVVLLHAFPEEAEREPHARDLHPFKFRNWAFACTGALPRSEALETAVREGLLRDLPDFIRRDVQGYSCAEALFHNFVWRLHEAGQLTAQNRDHRAVVKALREAVDCAAALSAEHGGGEARINTLTTDGNALYLLRRGATVAERLREGLTDCPLCYGASGGVDTFSLRESHQRFRGVFIAVDLDQVPPEWKLVEEGAALVVDERLEIQVL